MSTPIGELYKYTLEGAGYDSRQLREIEDWVIEPRLLQVPGVTDITPFGGVIKQYQIEVDPVALTKYNLSIRDIAQAVDANNQNAGGALLDNQQQGLVVRGVGLIQSVERHRERRRHRGQRRAGLRARRRHACTSDRRRGPASSRSATRPTASRASS